MIEADWFEMSKAKRIVWEEAAIEIICDCGWHLVISEGPVTCYECGATWDLSVKLMRSEPATSSGA